ncbi:hypothetical protein PRZ48_009108 [Zasmidium cellare]|uniref:SnoaL-like domain-containing protein n=1 Tax=Zasmidium cellare TaxID=395010 RepID=A0ABR0EI48_ZASCE|nr:hypothetical protein PRZ48_009108 [Zasmidium cellare]
MLAPAETLPRTAVCAELTASLTTRLRSYFDTIEGDMTDDIRAMRQFFRDEVTKDFSIRGHLSWSATQGPTREQYLQDLRRVKRNFPLSRHEITDVTTDVHLDHGITRQTVKFHTLGEPEGMVRRCVGVWVWVYEEAEGKWLLQSITGIYGPGDAVD